MENEEDYIMKKQVLSLSIASVIALAGSMPASADDCIEVQSLFAIANCMVESAVAIAAAAATENGCAEGEWSIDAIVPEFWKAGSEIKELVQNDSLDRFEKIARGSSEIGAASLRTLAKLPTGSIKAANWLIEKWDANPLSFGCPVPLDAITTRISQGVEGLEKKIDETITGENIYKGAERFNTGFDYWFKPWSRKIPSLPWSPWI